MDNEALTRHFEAIGARVGFRSLEGWRQLRESIRASFTIDIATDRRGEFFDIALGPDAPEFELLQTRPKERHLLLYARDGQRFLCGHDERHLFVAAIGKPISTVRAAKQALLPTEIWEQVRNLPPGIVDRRRNVAFVRQGEWFFVPTTREIPETAAILKNEPLLRTPANKPHTCKEIYREGGELVYIVRGSVMSEGAYKNKTERKPDFARIPYQTMIRNPIVYARGYVRHKDHATIRLNGWHRVFLNGEITSSHVMFLD